LQRFLVLREVNLRRTSIEDDSIRHAGDRPTTIMRGRFGILAG